MNGSRNGRCKYKYKSGRALFREVVNDSKLWRPGSGSVANPLDEHAAKKMILQKYSMRPVREFKQFDAFFDGFDSVVQPNEHGVALMSCETQELMFGTDVRVLIPPDSPKEKVIAALRGIIEWIEQDATALTLTPKPDMRVPFDDLPYKTLDHRPSR